MAKLTREQMSETFRTLDAALLSIDGSQFGRAWRHTADHDAGKMIVSLTDASKGNVVTRELTAVPTAAEAVSLLKQIAKEIKGAAKKVAARRAAERENDK